MQDMSKIRLKIIVSSRLNAKAVSTALDGLATIDMHDQNESDIRRHLTRELANLPGFLPPEREQAVERIIKKADGLFSYIPVAIEFLRQP